MGVENSEQAISLEFFFSDFFKNQGTLEFWTKKYDFGNG